MGRQNEYRRLPGENWPLSWFWTRAIGWGAIEQGTCHHLQRICTSEWWSYVQSFDCQWPFNVQSSASLEFELVFSSWSMEFNLALEHLFGSRQLGGMYELIICTNHSLELAPTALRVEAWRLPQFDGIGLTSYWLPQADYLFGAWGSLFGNTSDSN